MPRLFRSLSLLAVATTLSACSTPKYSCSAPETGIGCQPLREVHRQTADGSLPTLNDRHGASRPSRRAAPHVESDSRVDQSPDDLEDPSAPTAATAGPAGQTPGASLISVQAGQAILLPPRELRIWFDRWEDTDGDLHDESYLFIRLDNGRWSINDPE